MHSGNISRMWTNAAPTLLTSTECFRSATHKMGWEAVRARSFATTKSTARPILVPFESSCDFLLVINTNLRLILHRFRDSAFNRSKIATFGYLSFVYGNSPSEGLPWDDLRKMAYQIVPNCVETLPKISIAWVVCTNVTDRQQTTDRWQADGRWHIAIANNDW